MLYPLSCRTHSAARLGVISGSRATAWVQFLTPHSFVRMGIDIFLLVLYISIFSSAQKLVFGNSGSMWLMLLSDSTLCYALRSNDLSWGAQPNNRH